MVKMAALYNLYDIKHASLQKHWDNVGEYEQFHSSQGGTISAPHW